jgi:allantoate deiminase
MSMVADLDHGRLLAEDSDGKSLSFVLATEGWNNEATVVRYQKDEARAYVELHIEQGRVLEEMGLPASGVSCLVGQTRLMIRVTGQADHAGTTPMPLRRDALAGAAECITKVEAVSFSSQPGVATVGQIQVHPGAANAIPQTVNFSIDLRHPHDPERAHMRQELLDAFDVICQRRGLKLDWKLVLDNDATPCDPMLSDALLDSVESVTGNRESLISGAGHDGVALAPFMPIGMIFIRCREGISHHPDEYASPEDIATGIEILVHFLRQQTLKEASHHA